MVQVRSRFGIRRYCLEDISQLYEAACESINEIYPWLPWCHPNYSLEESSAWVQSRNLAWQEDKAYAFVIYDLQSGTFVGGVGLNQIDRIHQIANLGYWVKSSWTGRGAATTATRLTARFGFEKLNLQRIEIVVATDNTLSQRVAQKVGAKKEGILRKRLLIHNVPHNAVLYSLVKEDIDTDIADL